VLQIILTLDIFLQFVHISLFLGGTHPCRPAVGWSCSLSDGV